MSQRNQSLPRRILAQGAGREADLFSRPERTLKCAPSIEVSQALEYLFCRRPPEDWISLPTSIPNIVPPFEGPIFLEGTLGKEESFGVAVALGQGVSTARKEMRIARLGFLVEMSELSFAGFPWEVGWQAGPVVKVAPFVERHEGKARGRRIVWAIPVGSRGEVIYPVGEDNPAAFAVKRKGHNLNSVRALGEIYAPLLCGALFSLWGLNALSSGYASLEPLPTSDRRGSRHRLEAGRLYELLDQKGGAYSKGLSHALRVCGDGLLS